MPKSTRAVPELPCGREMYPELLPLREVGPTSAQTLRERLARAYQVDPKLLAIPMPNGGGTYWKNYVAWALAHGVTDGLLEGDRRSSNSSVYRLTALGEKKAHEFG